MVDSAAILNAKILVVDDLPANVRLLELILKGHGYVSVASTMDPTAVFELHRANRYDLILLDLQMPGMHGFEVMEGLKTIEAGGYLPVLVITAQPEKKLRALKTQRHSLELERALLAVHASREQLRHQASEVSLLYDRLAAEHQKLIESSAQAGAMVGVV